MTTSEPWYDVVGPSEKLAQGDLIIDCPLLMWDASKLPEVSGFDQAEVLEQFAKGFKADVVVMTQACDLEHRKVANVVLCPHVALTDFRHSWERAMREGGQNPSEKAWKKTLKDISEGFSWNQAFLNRFESESGSLEYGIVDFHEVFTVPRIFLESLLAQRKCPRHRLRPPYREHLSQAFARFFMRVGLPTPLGNPWESAVKKTE